MLYLGLAGLIFLAELAIKEFIERKKVEKEEEKILGDRVVLTKYHNEGAFLNAGDDRRETIAATSVVLTTICVAGFLITLCKKGREGLKLGLALLTGGALSNTYDRLVRKYVVDYLRLPVKNQKINRIVFNISDFCIVVGSFLTAICSGQDGKKKKKKK